LTVQAFPAVQVLRVVQVFVAHEFIDEQIFVVAQLFVVTQVSFALQVFVAHESFVLHLFPPASQFVLFLVEQEFVAQASTCEQELLVLQVLVALQVFWVVHEFVEPVQEFDVVQVSVP